jgi:hypothetical protein
VPNWKILKDYLKNLLSKHLVWGMENGVLRTFLFLTTWVGLEPGHLPPSAGALFLHGLSHGGSSAVLSMQERRGRVGWNRMAWSCVHCNGTPSIELWADGG